MPLGHAQALYLPQLQAVPHTESTTLEHKRRQRKHKQKQVLRQNFSSFTKIPEQINIASIYFYKKIGKYLQKVILYNNTKNIYKQSHDKAH
jgi:hypothetical protein